MASKLWYHLLGAVKNPGSFLLIHRFCSYQSWHSQDYTLYLSSLLLVKQLFPDVNNITDKLD